MTTSSAMTRAERFEAWGQNWPPRLPDPRYHPERIYTSWTFKDVENPPPPPTMHYLEEGADPIPTYSGIESITLERTSKTYATLGYVPLSLSWTFTSEDGSPDSQDNVPIDQLEDGLQLWVYTIAMPSLPAVPDHALAGQIAVHDFLYMGFKQVWLSVMIDMITFDVFGWRELP